MSRHAPQRDRALRALLAGPCSSQQLIAAAATVNPALLVHRVRNAGVEVLTRVESSANRYGERCTFGVYSLTPRGRRAAERLLAQGELDLD